MKFNFIIRFCLLAVVFTAALCSTYGQYTSNNGNFNIDEIKGCAPITITITSNESTCPCDATCPCDVWADATNNPNDFSQNNLSISYSTPGTYTLQVQLQNFNKDVIEIEVLDNVAPVFELTTCAANQVDVDIQDTNFDTYEIDYNDGTITTINNGQLVPTHTYAATGTKSINVRGKNNNAADNCITNNSQNVEIQASLQDAAINSLVLSAIAEATLNYTPQPNTNYHLQIAINNNTNFQRYLNDSVDPTQNTLTINDSNLDFERNYYCFRIGTFDKCTSAYTGFSNTICSVDLDNVAVGNNELALSWNTISSGINEYIITKNTDLAYSSVVTTNFTDQTPQITCNTEYCYRIIADYSTNGSVTSTSLERCATAISSDVPSAISDISVSVNAPNIDVSWELPLNFTPAKYQLYRNEASIPDTLTTTTITDIDIEQSCYRIDYTDVCINSSEMSEEICSIYLLHQIISGSVILNWNSYNGWANGVREYLVVVESSAGNATYNAGTSTTFQLPDESASTQQIRVTIQAVPSDTNLTTIISNSIEIFNSANIQFPNAFVPDGVNATFNVKGRYIESVNIKIYTRWGELIANVTDPENGWDGNINGSNAVGGTYVYVAEILDEAGKTHSRSGSVLLIRN